MATPFHMEFSKTLRRLCLWASCLSLIQTIIGIGLNIVGILLYYSIIWITPTENINYMIWNWGNLGINSCWLIISSVILLKIRRHETKLYATEIIVWIIFALIVCIADIALAIICVRNLGGSNDNTNIVYLLQMILIFKGFILWLINLGLVIALIIQLFLMGRKCGGLPKSFTLHDNTKNDSNQTTIDAYPSEQQQQSFQCDPNDIISTAFNNDGFETDTISGSNKIITSNKANHSDCIKINEDILIRIAHLSNEVTLLGRYFRNINSYVQYPPSHILIGSNDFRGESTATTATIANGVIGTAISTVAATTATANPHI